MARTPSPTVRTTLYRLVGLDELGNGIRDRYRNNIDFSETTTTVVGRDALLVTGAMISEVARWAPTIYALTNEKVEVGNKTAAGVLLIRANDECAWGLTYGMGFQLLDSSYFDPGFGQRIAIRSAEIAELSSVTRTTLDQRSRVDRLSIPSGDHLRNFGVGDFGELVTRLVAKARITGLTHKSASITIRGADALSVPLGKKASSLVDDLDVLAELLSEPVKPGLEMLEQLTLVKHDIGLIADLEKLLDGAIGDPTGKRIGLSWPHEQADEHAAPVAFRVSGAGRGASGPFDYLPTFEHLVGVVSDVSAGHRVDHLRKVRFQLLSDPDGDHSEAVSTAIPAIKWLAFETDHEGRRYFLHNGNWYLMDQDYAKRLKAQTKEILSAVAGFTMPEWPVGMKEERDYNELAASTLGGLVLDRKLIRTSLHRHGIELCDVLLSDGTLVHVKNIRGSDAASHHIAQALVSSDALLYDREASVEFEKAIAKAGGDSEWQPEDLKRVALAMARPTEITEDTLFTFTQVTLVRNVTALRERGIEVFVVPIKKPK